LCTRFAEKDESESEVAFTRHLWLPKAWMGASQFETAMARQRKHEPDSEKRGTRDHHARGDGIVERHLVFSEFAELQIRHLLHLVRMLGGNVGVLRPWARTVQQTPVWRTTLHQR
jgi:hypothetical protein